MLIVECFALASGSSGSSGALFVRVLCVCVARVAH